MKTINFLLFLMLGAMCLIACNKDEECGPFTYAADIKPIIDSSCAYSGCHSGADAGMWVSASSKDYTNYEGMLANLESGSFAIRVLDSMDMPSPFTPMGYPTELTQTQLDMIDCWIKDGYPKN